MTVPHQAFNGHPTTFKAIARGGDGTYVFEWDFTGDGTFDFSATTNDRHDLSTRFTYPNQATTVTFNAVIRVTSGGQTVTGTYPVRVFADALATPPVIRGVAVDDALWYLHTQMSRFGNEDDVLFGAQATGYIRSPSSSDNSVAASGFLWALSRNGHYAAFPSAYVGEIPDPADNAARFVNDPYAEDAMRLVNFLMTQASVVGVTAADEVNAVQRESIYGTDDLIGLYIRTSPGEQTAYPTGHAVAALSVANLDGFVAQVGESNRILGRRMEHVLQQLVDGLVWARGNRGAGTTNDDLPASLWSTTGLWHDDELAIEQGVIAPKLRTAQSSTLTWMANVRAPSSVAGQNSWDMGFATAGDFTRLDARGNHHGMQDWRDAADATAPELTAFVANDRARQCTLLGITGIGLAYTLRRRD